MITSNAQVVRLSVRALRSDDGVAALAIAGAIAVFAFSALSAFLSSAVGDRELALAQRGVASWATAKAALVVQINTQQTLLCPDRNLDGVAEGTCDGSGGNERNGTLPWATLGIAPKDVIDPYGNYYTYVVSDVAKDVCTSIANDYDSGADAEITGSLIVPTDLETLETSETLGTGIATPFVVLSHGPNGFGATSEGGVAQPAPPSGHTFETNNASDNPTAIYEGPFDDEGTNIFDDEVFTASPSELRRICEVLTPGGSLNTDITENFENVSGGIDTDNFDTTGSGTPPTVIRASNGDGVAEFTNGTSFLATATSFDFSPTIRPLYVATYWTPSPGAPAATNSGFSIATRATVADLGSGTDIFDQNTQLGLSFRFDDRDGSTSSSVGVPNNITIRDDTGQLAISSGTYSLINGETYLIEVYDNGNDVWMRITQEDDSSNTAFASTTTTTDLNSGDQRVLLINGPAQSFIDDVSVGVAMLALETNGTSGYAATAAAANGTTTGNLTLEAWIRPYSLPTGMNRAAIISQWDTNGGAADSDQSFRLYLDSDNDDRLAFDIGGTISSTADTETFDLGYIPTTNEWTHLAVTFDSTSKDVSLYVNGVLFRSRTSQTDAATGVATASERFSVGAAFDSGTTAGDFFHGNISDVRVWDDVRTRNEILSCFQTRIPTSTCTTTNLVVNWQLDPTPGEAGLAETDAVITTAGTAGTLTSASYSPSLANYFRPFSTDFCPSGTRVGAYQCDFRDSTAAGVAQSVTIPSNLKLVHAKVWGAGGGGWDRSNNSQNESVGGSGGFSQGLIESINGVAMAGQSLNIYYGGYGTGSFINDPNDKGGGGGAGAGIWNSLNTVAGLVAGGGGGANISDENSPIDCASIEHTVNQCGHGGHGGGAGGSANTTRAPDAGTNSCGGRGGDNSPSGAEPPSAAGSDCPDGGTDPVGTDGGGGADGQLGGGAGFAVMSGGNGIDGDEADGDGNNYAGAGGGGGGANGSGGGGGEAGGYRDQTNFQGYGGGGGSGTADAGVHNVTGEVRTLSFFENSTRGDFDVGTATITNVEADPAGLGWQVGMFIDASAHVPVGTTIVSIDSATQVTMSQNATGTQNNRRITVTQTTGGGVDDPDYSPSYLNGTEALQRPGTGGVASASINGRGGAVVLQW